MDTDRAEVKSWQSSTEQERSDWDGLLLAVLWHHEGDIKTSETKHIAINLLQVLCGLD